MDMIMNTTYCAKNDKRIDSFVEWNFVRGNEFDECQKIMQMFTFVDDRVLRSIDAHVVVCVGYSTRIRPLWHQSIRLNMFEHDFKIKKNLAI